jgi:hypothetical protein
LRRLGKLRKKKERVKRRRKVKVRKARVRRRINKELGGIHVVFEELSRRKESVSLGLEDAWFHVDWFCLRLLFGLVFV